MALCAVSLEKKCNVLGRKRKSGHMKISLLTGLVQEVGENIWLSLVTHSLRINYFLDRPRYLLKLRGP